MSTFPEDVSSSERIGGLGPIGQDQKQMGTPTQSFQSFMQSPTAPEGAPQATGAVPSPFDISQGQGLVPGKPTMGTLLSQINGVQTTMGDLSNQLSTPNLRLNRAQRYLLGNKLSDAQGYLRSAAMKMGAEESLPPELPPGATPVIKFLGILSNGQNQLAAAKEQLQQLQSSGKTIHPGDMLLLQVKLNKAQVEMEYASILLANAVSAMKNLFSTQI